MPEAGVPALQIEHRSKDGALREVCDLFWAVKVDKRGRPVFPHRTYDIAAKLAKLGRDIRGPRVPYLVAELCAARIADLPCPSCGGPWIVATRGEYVAAWQGTLATPASGRCRGCEDSRRVEREATRERELVAARAVAEAKRAAEEAARAAAAAALAAKRETYERAAGRARDVLRHWYNPCGLDAPDIESLSFERAVFLLAVAEGSGEDRSLPRIMPVEQASNLSPSGWLDRHIVRSLARDVLAVDPESDLDAFSWEHDPPPRPDWARVSFVARGEHKEGILWTVTALRHAFLRRDWNVGWIAQMPRLWGRIAGEEVLARLVLRLREFNFSGFSPTQEHREQILPMAEDFAVAHLWSLAWAAGGEAGALWRRRRLLHQDVVPTAITILASFVEQLRRGERRPHAAFREKALPQSSLSRAFFKTALYLPERYTGMTPEEYASAGLPPA